MKTTTKHARNSLVTFVTRKRFTFFFFLPSCCLNSLLSTIGALLSGAVRMSLVWISKTVVSHIEEEAMLLSVFYNTVIAILLVTVAVSTHLLVVCHHFIQWWIPEGPRGLAPHPLHPLIPSLDDCPLPLSEGLDRPLLSVLCCCFLAMSIVKILP